MWGVNGDDRYAGAGEIGGDLGRHLLMNLKFDGEIHAIFNQTFGIVESHTGIEMIVYLDKFDVSRGCRYAQAGADFLGEKGVSGHSSVADAVFTALTWCEERTILVVANALNEAAGNQALRGAKGGGFVESGAGHEFVQRQRFTRRAE
jgi:hypothetical protein